MTERSFEAILAASPATLTPREVVAVMGRLHRFSAHATFIATSDQLDMLEELDDVVAMVKESFATPPDRAERYWQGMDIRRSLNRDDDLMDD